VSYASIPSSLPDLFINYLKPDIIGYTKCIPTQDGLQISFTIAHNVEQTMYRILEISKYITFDTISIAGEPLSIKKYGQVYPIKIPIQNQPIGLDVKIPFEEIGQIHETLLLLSI